MGKMAAQMTTAKVIISYSWAGDGKKIKDLDDPCPPAICDAQKTVEEIAKRDLREDTATRDASLKQFREWISQNRDIEYCITDDNFLLRFLRTKKFSLPMAQQQLLKYLNLRRTFKHMTFNLDYLEPKTLELINNGYLFPSPIRDAHGRRVIIAIAGNFDAHKYSSTDMVKVHLVTYETLMNDEVNQVVGFTHFADAKSVTMSHVTIWSPTEFATILKWGEQSFPMRHKEIHGLNIPAGLKYIYDFACSRVSPKILERIKLYSSIDDMHNNLERLVLPKEYGGEIPMAEMIEMWKKELAENRERLLSLDKMNLLSDKGIIRRRDKVEDRTGTGSLPGSFRQLELD